MFDRFQQAEVREHFIRTGTSSIAVLIWMLGIAPPCSATVRVTLLEPVRVERTTSEPETRSFTFPGRPGPAIVRVQNGEVRNTRVTSAIISVNGNPEFGPNSFSKQVGEMEAAVIVGEENMISVELRGEPGSYLTITVVQDIEASAATVIGPQGGIVSVDSVDDPLYGVKLMIPAGALATNVIISVESSPAPLPPPFIPVGAAAKFMPENISFNSPVNLTLPFADRDDDGLIDTTLAPPSELEVLTASDDLDWVPIPISTVDNESKSVDVALTHFSFYVVVQRGRIDTVFEMDAPSENTLWRQESQNGSQAANCPGLPICAQHAFGIPVTFPGSGSADNKQLYVWTTAGSDDRVKFKTIREDFTEGVFEWRVFVPKVNVNVTQLFPFLYRTHLNSIGAFLLHPDPSGSCGGIVPDPRCFELDFEIVPGSYLDRVKYRLSGLELFVYMVSQANCKAAPYVPSASLVLNKIPPDSTQRNKCYAMAKITGDRWYTLRMSVKKIGSLDTEVVWAIDSTDYAGVRLAQDPQPSSIYVSVEHLPNSAPLYGDVYPPAFSAQAFLESVRSYKLANQSSSMGWADFVEGNPGVAGDGLSVTSDSQGALHLKAPIPVPTSGTGFTIAVFHTTPQTVFAAPLLGLSNSACTFVAGYFISWDFRAYAIYGGVTGLMFHIDQAGLDLWFKNGSGSFPHCGFTKADLHVWGVQLYTGNYTSTKGTIDAAYIVPGTHLTIPGGIVVPF